MFTSVFPAPINHLLRSASWARERLKTHAGKTACFRLAPLSVALTVAENGEVRVAPAAAKADLEVILNPGLALRLAAADESAFKDVRYHGDTEFASDVGFVLKNLRWEAEEDLSRIFGDVLAHRIAGAVSRLRKSADQAAINLARAFQEYWTEERPLIAKARDLAEFACAVDKLRDDVERLEKRLQRLHRKNTPGASGEPKP